MRGVSILSTSLVALAACAPAQRATLEGAGTSTPPRNPAYERALSSWVDRAEEDLVAAWGVPERSQRLTDGGQVFEYRRIGPDGRLLCSTLFTSDIYGQIRTWTYRGIDCRPPQLGDYGPRS